jgi:hypothetical protein
MAQKIKSMIRCDEAGGYVIITYKDSGLTLVARERGYRRSWDVFFSRPLRSTS